MPTPSQVPAAVSRRRVLCGLSAALLVPAALAACGSSDAPAGSDSSGSGSTGSGTPGTVLTPLADVPEGGGVVVEGPDGPVVVVQPSAGTVAAFSAVCPHAGTTVEAPADGVIVCPNHGSEFDAGDGAVTKGPAQSGLAAVSVRVEGDQVVLA